MANGEKPIIFGNNKRRNTMSENNRKPVAPYMAIGLSTVVYGIAKRKHI
jgi:hypothetical protein